METAKLPTAPQGGFVGASLPRQVSAQSCRYTVHLTGIMPPFMTEERWPRPKASPA
jgi:hypothetical protein